MKPSSARAAPQAPPPTCPYCSRPAEFLASSAPVYHGRDYGPVYICIPCQAWVGCHRGTTTPLGRLANAELRRAKRLAHDAFDQTWQSLLERRRRTDPRYPRGRARGSRYKRLADLLEMDPRDCHIGMFDVAQCMRVIALCSSGALDAD